MTRLDDALDPPDVPAPPRPSAEVRRGARHRAPTRSRARRPVSEAADVRTVAVGGLAVGLVAVAVALGPRPLPGWCAAVAAALHLASNGQYAVAVARRQARPNIVSWLLWGLIPMVAVAAQLDDRPGPGVAVTFVVGLGPLVVATVALRTDRSASRLTPFTVSCALAALAGVVAWQVTTAPSAAIAFCILADVLAMLPTLRKVYDDPDSEHAPPYVLAVVGMVIALGAVEHPGFAAYGFPAYVLLANAVLFALATLPVARIVRRAVTGTGAVVRRNSVECVSVVRATVAEPGPDTFLPTPPRSA